MMERKSLFRYLHTGYNIKFIQTYRNKKNNLSEMFRLIYQVYDISFKNPSFLGKKLLKGGHTLLFAMHKCGNTKEECPPFINPSFFQKKNQNLN